MEEPNSAGDLGQRRRQTRPCSNSIASQGPQNSCRSDGRADAAINLTYNAAIRALLNSVQGPELVLLTGTLLFTFDNFNGNEGSKQIWIVESSADRAGGVASRRLGVSSGVFAHLPQRPRLESPYRFKPAANIISSRPPIPITMASGRAQLSAKGVGRCRCKEQMYAPPLRPQSNRPT